MPHTDIEKLRVEAERAETEAQKGLVGATVKEILPTVGRAVETVLPGVKAIRESIQQRSVEPELEFLKQSALEMNTPEGIEAMAIAFTPIGIAGRVAPLAPRAIPRAIGRSPSFKIHFDFFKSISAPKKFRPPAKATEELIEETLEKGIALRTTKGGKVVPAVRKSGPFVPEDFPTYKNFKDVQQGAFGGTKDITRMVQEMDGALSANELVKLTNQAGPTTRYVLWRTRDMIRQSIMWSGEMAEKLKAVQGGIRKGTKEARIANRVLEKISSKDLGKPIEVLLKKPTIAKITKNSEVVRFAKEARVYFDDLLDMQNAMRKLRHQEIIPKRELYSPHEFQNRSLWEKAFGLKKEPIDVMRSPQLPDYIFPDKPFNPRALARESGLGEFRREMDLPTLLDNYTRTAMKDIYSTSIVQNNKAFIQEFETLGLKNSATAIQNWTAESFAGVKAHVDRAANLSPRIAGAMRWGRQKLVRAVFPLNFAWNLGIQTSSITLTGTRYGWLNTGKSGAEWFASKAIRDDIANNAYSAIIKAQKVGRITTQDINTGIIKARQLERKPLEKAMDAANYFTEWIERHLTGISVRSAYNDGAKRGLKGKSLWEYASDGGAKTQSMYNMEDLPGILRANLVKTAFPFQTFRFEMFNTMREIAGKTGVPPGTAMERMKWILRFTAGAYATTQVASLVGGSEPWKASAFLPFWGNIITPALGKTPAETARGLPAPVGIARDFWIGVENYIKKEDPRRLRKAMVKYLLPFGGVQVSRTVEGIIASANEGFETGAGKLLFPIVSSKEKARALWGGPFFTEAGQEFLEARK